MFAYALRTHVPKSGVRAATAVAVSASAAFVYLSNNYNDDNESSNRTHCKAAKDNQKVVIVGGGTGGLGVAAMLQSHGITSNVTIIEPKDVHWYQPLWTLVGGGIFSNTESAKPMKDVVPKHATWIQQPVSKFRPETNRVTLENGDEIEYDYLVVATGMKSDFNAVPGMQDGLETPGSGVVSVYNYNYSKKVWDDFNSIVMGRVNKGMKTEMVFTMPTTTLKCAGAPQKIMWLLEDTIRSKGQKLRELANVYFIVPGASMFGVPFYAAKLEKVRQEKNVDASFNHVLTGIDVGKKIATFQDKVTGKKVEKSYDLLHVCPNMTPMDFLKGSPIADQDGWVDVDKHTLQSKKYENVFALGDCTNTPNSKTAAAITSQAPVLVHNMYQHMNGQAMDGAYDGYASCPLIIGRKKIMLAEFGYGGKIMETFSRETGKFPWKYFGTDGAIQYRFFYFLKEQMFPYVYWNLWTIGRWYGTNGPIKPDVTAQPATATTAGTSTKKI